MNIDELKEKASQLIRDYTNQQLDLVRTGNVPIEPLTSEGQAEAIFSLVFKEAGICPDVTTKDIIIEWCNHHPEAKVR